jgi:phenylacetate-CoA ligase
MPSKVKHDQSVGEELVYLLFQMDTNKEIFKYLIYYPIVLIRGQCVPSYLGKLLQTQYLTRLDLASLQIAKLQCILAYAKRSVPFYGKTLAEIPDNGIKALIDLQRLPFVSKADLKQSHGAMMSRERFYFLTKKTTGGSTGEPVTIPKTRSAMAWELAATWRGYSWAGIDIGDRQGRFWGVPFGKKDRARANLIDFIANRKRCSAFSFSEGDLQAYTTVLERFRPTYFYGYVSMIEEYAKFFKHHGITPPFKLKCVITTSEVLTASHRGIIEGVFATKVFNEYGSGELGSVAHECEEGSLHVSAENMIVEVMDGNRPCKAEEVGELVVTELNNHAAPLIRYRTGDFASLSEEPCKCGRTLPVIKNLFGRAYDMIRNSEGKLFHGELMMYIFEEAQRKNLGIRGFQVTQEDIRSFAVKIVPDEQYGQSTEDFITHRIREQFDPNVRVRFERVLQIERATSGKMRLIIGIEG